jgi:hypothetical protein
MRDLGHPSVLTDEALGVPKETADPSASLGMTNRRGWFDFGIGCRDPGLKCETRGTLRFLTGDALGAYIEAPVRFPPAFATNFQSSLSGLVVSRISTQDCVLG